MNNPEIKPMPYGRRRGVFRLLVAVFVVSLPFLFLYAKGYRLDLAEQGNFVSTGGMYVTAERVGAEIFIDDELVRETRIFRTAFYAQNIEPGTHKVHVQKEDGHTWVKELPVYPHLVTEAQAFNLPLVSQLKIISEWQTQDGEAVLLATSSLSASTTNSFFIATSTATSTYIQDTAYSSLLKLFATTSQSKTTVELEDIIEDDDSIEISSTTEFFATTTKEWRGVRLYEDSEDVYARWVGNREDMPYYYCAKSFEPLGGASSTVLYGESQTAGLFKKEKEDIIPEINSEILIPPVQVVKESDVCTLDIQIDRNWQTVTYFDFYPGSTDLVIMALEKGVYVVEIDNRAWQNVQPLILGEGLDVRVENGNIYMYDNKLIYQILLN